jgi:hypothetical protein
MTTFWGFCVVAAYPTVPSLPGTGIDWEGQVATNLVELVELKLLCYCLMALDTRGHIQPMRTTWATSYQVTVGIFGVLVVCRSNATHWPIRISQPTYSLPKFAELGE